MGLRGGECGIACELDGEPDKGGVELGVVVECAVAVGMLRAMMGGDSPAVDLERLRVVDECFFSFFRFSFLSFFFFFFGLSEAMMSAPDELDDDCMDPRLLFFRPELDRKSVV